MNIQYENKRPLVQEYNELMRGVLCFISHGGESMGNKKGVDAQ